MKIKIFTIFSILTILAACMPSQADLATESADSVSVDEPAAIPPTNKPKPAQSPTDAPTKTSQPTRPPQPVSMQTDMVWYAPNMGSSDFPNLFNEPEKWILARNKLDVFQFYTQNLLPDNCDICGNNLLGTFTKVDAFRKLKEWDIPISIEVGAVKEWGCFEGANDEELRVANEVIQNVRSNGGDVAILAMDEPRIYGESKECSYTVPEIAKHTADFINKVHRKHPQIVIGDIEPYPHYSYKELTDWVLELKKNNVELAFFHLDVDVERVRVEGQNVSRDLQAFDEFFHEHGIPFGVILTSNWRDAGSNKTYYDSTMKWTSTVNEAMGKPEHVIFQSWQGPAANGLHEIPINLPQNDPELYSHIRLINEGLKVVGNP